MQMDDEIKLMNDSLTGDHTASTDAPSTSSPSTTAPVTATPDNNDDQLLTEAPSTAQPATEAPSTTAPATTAPVTSVPDDRDKTISELRAEIEAMKAEKPPKSVPATAAPEEVKPLNFVTEDEFEEAQSDPKKLNELLSKVYERATTDLEKKFERRFEEVPNTVSEQLKMQEELTKIRTNFYSANPDLEPFQKVVGIVFEELQTKTPDKKYQDILKDVGPEVRKRLNLPVGGAPSDKGKSSPPPLPHRKGKSGQPSSNKPSNDLSSEIDQMNKSLGV